VAELLNSLHPDASKLIVDRGLLCSAPELEMHIDRVVRFKNWKPSMGTQKRDYDFKIIGVQRDWQSRACWRVLCLDGQDTFGCVAHPDEVDLIDQPARDPAP
jgi:hypothetical protein